jgi:putative SOS response-associated peptidase YedK
MPVILHPEEYDLWLDRETTDPGKLKHLYQPYPADLMEMYPVSPLVNSPRNDSPDLIKPLN